MFFPDKSKMREKLNNLISLNYKNVENDFDLSESYTTNNIVSNDTITSSYEYGCIPSKSSFLKKNSPASNSDYFYGSFNQNIPSNNLTQQPVIYTINHVRETPYLLYLLKLINNQYDFINTIMKKENFEETTLFLSQSLDINLKYSGFITYNNVNYLFYNSLDKLKEIDGYEWSLITEIINCQKIYNIKINDYVKTLLLNNRDLINIYNLNKSSLYELPNTCYFLNDRINGCQLYCSDYHNLSRIISNIEQTEYQKYYISRCVVFNGIIKCKNKIDNIFDYSNSNYSNDSNEYNSVYNLLMPDVKEVYLLIEINDKTSYKELSRLTL